MLYTSYKAALNHTMCSRYAALQSALKSVLLQELAAKGKNRLSNQGGGVLSGSAIHPIE